MILKKYVRLLVLLTTLLIIGCVQNTLKPKPSVKKINCDGPKSSNSIVVINGRTKLIYDKNLDKECGSN